MLKVTYFISLVFPYFLLVLARRKSREFKVHTSSCSSDYSDKAISRLLKGQEVLFVGDSIVRNSFLALIQLLEREVHFSSFQSKLLQRTADKIKRLKEQKIPGRDGRHLKIWSYRHQTTRIDYYYARTTKDSKLILSKYAGGARYSGIIYSNSIWDMGRRFHGYENYYIELGIVLNILQKHLKNAESKVIILGLPFLETSSCPNLNMLCIICNHKLVQNYVRELQQRVVSCTPQSSYFDTLQFTNTSEAKSLSQDGVHPGVLVARASVILALNYLFNIENRCNLFQKRNRCDDMVPRIASEKVLEARSEVEEILEHINLKHGDIDSPRCFADHNMSLFWNPNFFLQGL